MTETPLNEIENNRETFTPRQHFLAGRIWCKINTNNVLSDITCTFMYGGQDTNIRDQLYDLIVNYDEVQFETWLGKVTTKLALNTLEDEWLHQQPFNVTLSRIHGARITVCLMIPSEPLPNSGTQGFRLGLNIETN